jgi:hypothetical protein
MGIDIGNNMYSFNEKFWLNFKYLWITKGIDDKFVKFRKEEGYISLISSRQTQISLMTLKQALSLKDIIKL